MKTLDHRGSQASSQHPINPNSSCLFLFCQNSFFCGRWMNFNHDSSWRLGLGWAVVVVMVWLERGPCPHPSPNCIFRGGTRNICRQDWRWLSRPSSSNMPSRIGRMGGIGS
ncbi:hypothetical protein ABW19_dt0205896 [Dactylella cylindrospora]|nr:hypothetical protein ABW19_dt0205896 [Dactylella cylindrospora]